MKALGSIPIANVCILPLVTSTGKDVYRDVNPVPSLLPSASVALGNRRAPTNGRVSAEKAADEFL